jgi:Flp pilus assembly protein TadB
MINRRRNQARELLMLAGFDDTMARRVRSGQQGQQVLSLAATATGERDPQQIGARLLESPELREAVRSLMSDADRQDRFGVARRRGRRKGFILALAWVGAAVLAVMFLGQFFPELEDQLPAFLQGGASRDAAIAALGGASFIVKDVFNWLFGGYRLPRQEDI